MTGEQHNGTAVAVRPAAGGALATHMTDEQLDLVKRQICKPSKRTATNDELALFRYQCERTGLDPFSRQIYAIFRWDNRTKDEKMTIQVAIDGLRLVAERTGKYLGQDGPFWCGEDGQWSDVWIAKGHPLAAKVIVKKLVEGQIAETPAVAHFDEYAPKYKGELSGLWPTKGALMIAKCAEALALRKAFPAETSGLYTAEEMAQADVVTTPVAQPQPQPQSVEQTTEVGPTVVDPQTGEVQNLEQALASDPEGLQAMKEAFGAVEIIGEERVESIISGLRALKLTYADIDMLLGSVGLDALRARSAKAVEERIADLEPEQADVIEAEMSSMAEGD